MKTVGIKIAAFLLISTASCRAPLVQPGAPGRSSRLIPVEKAADLSPLKHTAADVKFMQEMIGHHAQALEMTALVSGRTSRDDMKLLALRISVSQADEIKMMQSWLAVRGETVPGEHAHHMPGAPLMPGMLTEEEMARLTGETGSSFDKLFLEFMIKHHDGALVMVQELFSTAGGGQDSEIFAFASDVEADQLAEIDRMSAMLREF